MSCSARMRPWRGPRAEKGGHGVFHAAGGLPRCRAPVSSEAFEGPGVILRVTEWSFIFGPAAGGWWWWFDGGTSGVGRMNLSILESTYVRVDLQI